MWDKKEADLKEEDSEREKEQNDTGRKWFSWGRVTYVKYN